MDSDSTGVREGGCGHAHHHGHHHHGHHHAQGGTTGQRLLVTLAINLFIPAVQVAAGIAANSMALLADAFHNFSDSVALAIAYLANRIGSREASARYTFGFRRAEVLGAVANVVLLVLASGYLLYESGKRMAAPQEVRGLLVVGAAAIGIVGNGLSALILRRDAAHDLNVKGAFLHMIGDLLTSIAVAGSGLILLYRPWYWLDPLLSVGIAFFIIKNGWIILNEALRILMNAAPVHIDLCKVKERLEAIPGVTNVHFLHAWNVSAASTVFSCHVVVPDQPLSATNLLTLKVRHVLLQSFGIDHPVLQFETSPCGEGEMVCGDRKCGTMS